MKRLKYLLVSILFAGFVGNASEFTDSSIRLNNQLLQLLNGLYDQHKDNFARYVSPQFPFELCKKALEEGQEALKKQMGSLSYKNDVLFSKKGIKNTGLLVGSLVGILFSDWFMQHHLEQVTYNIAEDLHKNRDSIIWKWQNTDREYDPQNLFPLGLLRGTYKTWWRVRGVQPSPAESLVEGLKRILYGKPDEQIYGKLPYSTYLTLYQVANKALSIGAAIGGVGLAQDIKAFQDKKKSLSEEYDKYTKMLELLEKENEGKPVHPFINPSPQHPAYQKYDHDWIY